MRLLYTALFCLFGLVLFAQSPQKFNYQAIARDITGQPAANRNIAIQFTILETSINGSVRYAETHSVTSNDFGLINVTIGDGTPVLGTFSNIDWGADSHFLRVDMDVNGGTNYITVSTTQLMAVPYALYADKAGHYDETDGDTTNEIQHLTKNGNSLSLSKNGGSVLLNDEDPTNELQQMTKNGRQVSLTNGGSFYLNDDDTTNELQTIAKNGATITLSKGGGSITLLDDDGTNELQTIDRVGDTVTLSQGGGYVSIRDADADPTNELQTISRNGNNITLSNGGGTVNVNDDDNDTTNELQTISRNGIVATLSNGGGSFVSPDTIVLNYIICVQGATPGVGGASNVDSAMVGEIRLFAGNFAPNGWLFCQGQIIPISQNGVLFSILGSTYGGDGVTTFAIPDLRKKIPIQH